MIELPFNKWLNLALIARVFGGQADTILTSIRSVFTKNIKTEPIRSQFPAAEIIDRLKGTTKEMTLNDEYIENLLFIQKDDNLTFSLLTLLYPNLDYQNGNFHKDHIHPISKFNTNVLKENNIDQDQYEFFLNPENNNSILNLQMLDSNENMSKQDKELKDWVETEVAKQGISINKMCENHVVPKDYLEIKDFRLFIEERKRMLMNKLKSIF